MQIRWNWIFIDGIQLKRAVDTKKAEFFQLNILYLAEQTQRIKVLVTLGE